MQLLGLRTEQDGLWSLQVLDFYFPFS